MCSWANTALCRHSISKHPSNKLCYIVYSATCFSAYMFKCNFIWWLSPPSTKSHCFRVGLDLSSAHLLLPSLSLKGGLSKRASCTSQKRGRWERWWGQRRRKHWQYLGVSVHVRIDKESPIMHLAQGLWHQPSGKVQQRKQPMKTCLFCVQWDAAEREACVVQRRESHLHGLTWPWVRTDRLKKCSPGNVMSGDRCDDRRDKWANRRRMIGSLHGRATKFQAGLYNVNLLGCLWSNSLYFGS